MKYYKNLEKTEECKDGDAIAVCVPGNCGSAKREKCSHIIVRYYWSEVDDYGLTHGWWECENCDQRFVPISILQNAKATIDELRAEIARDSENE